MANYSQNPTNPNNDPNTQYAPVAQQPVPQMGQDPKSIRDYLAAARSSGAVPTFTNVQETPGFFMGEPQQQAIPEGPQNEYERMPFSDRIRMLPSQRAEQRMQTMLPELWDGMFPGMQQGVNLDDMQMKRWQGAVASLTSDLTKHYEKQYEWSIKNQGKDEANRSKERKFWQSKFVDATLRGTPVLNDDGTPMSEVSFVKERLAAADEMKFKEDVEEQDRQAAMEPTGAGTSQMTPGQVAEIMRGNPDLARAIRLQIKTFVEDGIGRQLSDSEYDQVLSSPDARSLVEEASRDAVEYYSDRLQKATQK